MRFFLRVILTLLIGYFAAPYLPWQALVVIAFAVGALMAKKKKRRIFSKPPPRAWTFASGFLAGCILWGGAALWIDAQNMSILSEKVAAIFLQIQPEAGYGSQVLILITALLGGLLGGFGMMTGHFLGKAIK